MHVDSCGDGGLQSQADAVILVLVDAYEAFQGLLTLDDLLQELVGDIATPGMEEEQSAVKREDGSWLIDGMLPIHDVEELTGFGPLDEDERGGFQTLGGFMMAQLNRIPAPADTVTVKGFRFEVMDMDGRRVDKVLVVPPKQEE